MCLYAVTKAQHKLLPRLYYFFKLTTNLGQDTPESRVTMPPLYEQHSRVPLASALTAAIQHVGVTAVTLAFPILIADAAGVDSITKMHYLSLCMIALGIGTLLQAVGRFGIGSGYLIGSCFTAIYLPSALLAARAGGLSAVAGLTIAAGVTEILLSRMTLRVRRYLPTELIGLIILVLGITLGTIAIRMISSLDTHTPTSSIDTLIALVSLGVTITIGIWASDRIKSIAVLLGLTVGGILFALYRLSTPSLIAHTQTIDYNWFNGLLSVPSLPLGLLPGFMLGAITATARATGDIITAQRTNSANWKRTNFASVQSGLLSDGLSSVIAGLLGVCAINTYSGSVGLSAATGITARRVAWWTGGLWIVLALIPGVPSMITMLPKAVLGAILFYVATFIIRSGFSMLADRMLDTRRTITIGTALILGLSLDTLPALYRDLPTWFLQLLPSSLAVALFVGILLNFLFSIGQRRVATLHWNPTDGYSPVAEFLRASAGTWGARIQLINRALLVAEEYCNIGALLVSKDTSVRVRITYDEVCLKMHCDWHGIPIVPLETLSLTTDAAKPALAIGLALRLIDHHSDGLRIRTKASGLQRLDATISDA